MGLFRTSDSFIGRAMPLTGLVGVPNAAPAWVFQNQTGVLGTNLNSSVTKNRPSPMALVISNPIITRH